LEESLLHRGSRTNDAHFCTKLTQTIYPAWDPKDAHRAVEQGCPQPAFAVAPFPLKWQKNNPGKTSQ
jgi:hypothetical protein